MDFDDLPLPSEHPDPQPVVPLFVSQRAVRVPGALALVLRGMLLILGLVAALGVVIWVLTGRLR